MSDQRRVANSLMTRPRTTTIEGVGREGVLHPLRGKKNVGIELGVAGGSFSSRMVQSGRFQKVFGVDTYDDYYHHIEEYREALSSAGLLTNYSLLRMTFEEARPLFGDEFFDFIYVDGFAHTGQEGGKTLSDWFSALKVGGVMAGDDYDDVWPLVQWAVNDFATAVGVELQLTEVTENSPYNRHPSWFFVKTAESRNREYVPHPELAQLAESEKARIAAHRRAKGRKRALKAFKKRVIG